MMTIEYLRQFRIDGFALFDFTLAFVGIAILAPLVTWLLKKIHISVPFHSWLLLTLPIAIITHLVLGIHTPLTVHFLDVTGFYPTKIIILLLLILGLKDIKRLPRR